VGRFLTATVGAGSIVNEVQFVYDDFGQLVTEYQEHDGAVNTSTSLKVGYTYANGSSNTIRLTKMAYPDGRELNYRYGSLGSTDDALSRVASLIDDDGTTHLVDYSYVGAGSFIKTDYADIDVHCDLAHGTGSDPYDGPMDRFGRVTDLLWRDYGSSTDVLRVKHGYDRGSNRLYREEADTSDLDQLYSYDDVNRLTQSEEGTLSGTKDSVSSLNFEQQWSLDATGNWSGFKEDDDGDSTWDLDQTRTSNKVNEITDVTETAGPSWLTPAYNRAGNMTTVPKPGAPTLSYVASYDAWNRLVKLEDGANTVAEYVFDGAKRLVVRKKYVSGSLNQTRHFYHTAQWQTIEERLETGGAIASTADRQFTWGLRYIDDLICRTVNSTHDYAYQDANWNVVLSSSALARVVYQPYGQIRSTSPAAQANLGTWQHYFAGYRRDEDTGLYLVRHRVYQPELGSWVQRDPIGYAASETSVYAAIGNDPIALIDPLGLFTKQVWKWRRYQYQSWAGDGVFTFKTRGARPVYEAGINSAGKEDNVPFTGGEAFRGAQRPVTITYLYSKPCTKVLLVQIARVTELDRKGKRIVHWFKEQDYDPSSQKVHLRNQMKTAASGAVQAGWFIDHFPGHGALLLGHYPGMQPGVGDNTREAILSDAPGGGTWEPGKGDRFEFETCAVCADNCMILGCLQWGIEFNRVYWWPRWYSSQKDDALYSSLLPCRTSRSASANFFAAMTKYNEFHGTNYVLE
jgi:RHS repeat-associated protein